MTRKLLLGLAFLCVLPGMALAKEKIIPFKKLNQSDIGNPALSGTAKIRKKNLIITAGGADVWGKKDEFHFSWMEEKGDFDIMVQVAELSDPHLYTKAGLMVREELAEDSRHIFFQVFPNNKPRNKNNGGYEFQYRQKKGNDMKAIYPPKASGMPEFPVNYPNTWLRLKRDGDSFTAFCSPDGKMWKTYTKFRQDFPRTVYIGLAVTSHNIAEAATAEFRNLIFIK